MIIKLESMLDGMLDRISLEPCNERGTIPIFQDHTEALARIMHESESRTRQLYKEPISDYERNKAYYFHDAEHHAKLGALAAIKNKGGHVYEFGCGAALPSATYALITGNNVTAVDRDEVHLEKAERTVRLLGIEHLVELINRPAEEVDEGLKPNDLVILEGPNGSLTGYFENFSDNHDSDLIASLVMEATMMMLGRRGVRIALDNHIKKNGYETQIAKTKFDEYLFVVYASKNPV